MTKPAYIRNLIAGETEELYDLTSDPDELINLAHDARHDVLLKRLRAATIAELKRTEVGLVANLPPVGTDRHRQSTTDKQNR